MIEQNMGRLAIAIASGFGAEASLDFRLLFAPTVNDTTSTPHMPTPLANWSARRASTATPLP